MISPKINNVNNSSNKDILWMAITFWSGGGINLLVWDDRGPWGILTINVNIFLVNYQ